MSIQIVNPDVQNVLTELENIAKLGRYQQTSNAPARAAAVGSLYGEHRERILPVLNAGTNTISADLKRVAILQETIRAFALRLLPLRLFSTVFNNVPLQGTDEITVPYFPLRTDASNNWNAANGYVFSGTTNTQAKKITVDKRKYQPLDYSSETFRRQPGFNVAALGAMNAERLAADVLFDVLSIVTESNFGPAVKSIDPAGYVSDDVVDLQTAANDLNWPETGRGLIVNTAVDGALKKDNAFKLALNIGGTEVIRGGQLPNVFGFQYAYMPNFPTNSENLIGMITFASAILAAFSPVEPAAGVRSRLIAYDVVTDPQTGISMNYRHWGDPQMDKDYEVIETAYGFEAGETAALRRLTSQ